MDSNKIIRVLVGGFFFISALYVAIERETFYPFIGFMIFIILAYAMGYFFKKEKVMMKEGKVPLKGLSVKMFALVIVAVLYIVVLSVYYQGPALDEKTTDIILRYVSGMGAFAIAFFVLYKPLQFNNPKYMFFIDKKGSILRFIILLSLAGVLMILSYEGLKRLI